MSNAAATVTRCMLFAAGRGNRLRPLTDKVPKPLLPVGGRPLLDRQLDALAAADIQQVVINVSYLGEQLEARLAQRANPERPVVTIARETEALETGGGLLAARSHFKDPFIWLLNGDVLFDKPLSSFPRSLAATDDLHLLLVPTPAHRARGDFSYAAGRITRRGDEYVYGSLAVLRLAAFDRYAAALRLKGEQQKQDSGQPRKFSLRDFLFDRVEAGRVSASIHEGRWFDIGNLAQLKEADRWAHGQGWPGTFMDR